MNESGDNLEGECPEPGETGEDGVGVRGGEAGGPGQCRGKGQSEGGQPGCAPGVEDGEVAEVGGQALQFQGGDGWLEQLTHLG